MLTRYEMLQYVKEELEAEGWEVDSSQMEHEYYPSLKATIYCSSFMSAHTEARAKEIIGKRNLSCDVEEQEVGSETRLELNIE